MTSRTVEMWLTVAPLLVFVAGFLSVVWWLVTNFNGSSWERRHTWGVLRRVLVTVVLLITCKVGSGWHRSERAFQIAQMVGHEPAGFLNGFETNRYKPGMVWQRGGFALGGFDHGTAWCHGYETEGREISAFAFENPAVVYIDVDDDDVLDGVGAAQAKKGYFPRLARDQVVRRPTHEEQRRYAALLRNFERRSL